MNEENTPAGLTRNLEDPDALYKYLVEEVFIPRDARKRT